MIAAQRKPGIEVKQRLQPEGTAATQIALAQRERGCLAADRQIGLQDAVVAEKTAPRQPDIFQDRVKIPYEKLLPGQGVSKDDPDPAVAQTQAAQIEGERQFGAGQGCKIDQGGIEHVDKKLHLRADNLNLAQVELVLENIPEAVADGDLAGMKLTEDEEVIAGGGIGIGGERDLLKDEAAQGMQPDLSQREAAIQFFNGRLIDHRFDSRRGIEQPQDQDSRKEQKQKGEKGEEDKPQQTAQPGTPVARGDRAGGGISCGHHVYHPWPPASG
ncbi:MAG: hypothetical protein BWY77_00401 [bacterium ADurb.Bin431]|nr:MAG: hypothetical protein BWY77_00401 [bacterium ADurb.Bin431]